MLRLPRNPLAWSRLKGLLGFLFLAFALPRQECTAEQEQAQPGISERVASLRIRYHSTAEAAYQEIEVNGTKLRFTYFEDVQHRCERWSDEPTEALPPGHHWTRRNRTRK